MVWVRAQLEGGVGDDNDWEPLHGIRTMHSEESEGIRVDLYGGLMLVLAMAKVRCI